MSRTTPSYAAIIPCKDEARRIRATVTATLQIDEVGRVIVVDDGSSDDTAANAYAAGADVIQHASNAGKAAALSTGVRYLRSLERAHGQPTRADLLFVDGDLEESAVELAALIPPVRSGEVDMTIANLPPQKTAGGGHGFVVRLAQNGIRDLTGFEAQQPLSGQRALTAAAFDAALPLAAGWAVDMGLTLDVLAAGMVVREVPCELQHRVSGADWRGQLHRAEQYRDVAAELTRRRLRRLLSSR